MVIEDIAEIAANRHDLEGKTVGVIDLEGRGYVLGSRVSILTLSMQLEEKLSIHSSCRSLRKGHLAGYAGDVWFPEPAPANHPWRNMPNHRWCIITPAQLWRHKKRYPDGIKNSLVKFLNRQPIERDYLIVDDGKVSPSYSYAFKKKSCSS